MDSVRSLAPSANRSTRPPTRLSRPGWILLALALAAYGILLAQHMGAYAGGSDSSGYLNHARLLGQGRVHVPPRIIPALPPGEVSEWLYAGLGFKPSPDPTMLVPTYPTGLPLLIGGVALVTGWSQAANVVMWLHALAGVVLTCLTGRAFGLSRRIGIVAAVIIGGSPVYLFFSLHAMSDVPALVWTTGAVLAAWKSRERATWSVLAGAAFALAVLIRPTNVLALAPIALCLGLSWRRWLGFGAGGLPGGLFFCVHNHFAYGKYLTTGYGDSAGLAWKWVAPTLAHYARWLPALFTPVALAWLALPGLFRRAPLRTTVLLIWFLVFAAFYTAYEFTHETWWYLRFLLPAAPALVVGGLLVLQNALSPRLSCRGATLAACMALVLAVASNTYWSQRFDVLNAGRGERTYPVVTEWLTRNLPPDAVIAAMQHTGALHYYTDFTFVRADMLNPATFGKISDVLAREDRPLYAVLWPFEIEEYRMFERNMPGPWQKVETLESITIWRWTGPTAAD